MRHYDIAFLGLGSIGKRHLLNVCALLDKRGDSYNVDLYRSSLKKDFHGNIAARISGQYLYAGEIEDKKVYDIVFVTNPTSMHYESILKFHTHAKSFFIEKPIFDSTDVDESIFELIKEKLVYVACPLRYNPIILYVKEHIPYKDAFAIRAISSSYLPDWRPGIDYRTCYSAHRKMGGGVGIDLIHEWDYLAYFFGMPTKCFNIQDKVSNLEVDSDDIAIYIAKMENKTIELHLDYFGKKTLRSFELFMPEETIHCDITNGKIEYLTTGKTINLNSERNDFQMAEIEHFFDIIDGNIENDSTPRHAYDVLKLAKGII